MDPETPAAKRMPLSARLESAAKKRDTAEVSSLCVEVNSSLSRSNLAELGETDSMMKDLVAKGRRGFNSSVLSLLEKTAGLVHEAYRQKAVESDHRPNVREADTLLLVSARNGDLQGVKAACAKGADLHAKDDKGMTAMEHAMGSEVYFDLPVQRHPEVVDFLREAMQASVKDIRPSV